MIGVYENLLIFAPDINSKTKSGESHDRILKKPIFYFY